MLGILPYQVAPERLGSSGVVRDVCIGMQAKDLGCLHQWEALYSCHVSVMVPECRYPAQPKHYSSAQIGKRCKAGCLYACLSTVLSRLSGAMYMHTMSVVCSAAKP